MEKINENWLDLLKEPPENVVSDHGRLWFDKVRRGIKGESLIFPDTSQKGRGILEKLRGQNPSGEIISQVAKDLRELFEE